jgi:serine/threonine-protein kinase RsbW
LYGGEIVAGQRRGFRRDIEALEEIFRFLDGFLDEAGVDDRSVFTLKLVVEELFTNMVRHAAGGGDEIDLRIEREDDRIHVELVDTGVDRFDPAEVALPNVDADIGERSPGGLGLHIVKAMVDNLDYRYEPETRQMRVSVTKRLES